MTAETASSAGLSVVEGASDHGRDERAATTPASTVRSTATTSGSSPSVASRVATGVAPDDHHEHRDGDRSAGLRLLCPTSVGHLVCEPLRGASQPAPYS